MPLLGADDCQDDPGQGKSDAGDQMHCHGNDDADDGSQGPDDGGESGALVLGDLDGGRGCTAMRAGQSAVVDARWGEWASGVFPGGDWVRVFSVPKIVWWRFHGSILRGLRSFCQGLFLVLAVAGDFFGNLVCQHVNI